MVTNAYEAFRAQPSIGGAEAPPPNVAKSFDSPQDMNIASESTVTATLHTSCGDIVLDLDPQAAPHTVNSFVFLAKEGFFDGTVSHRIVPGFMVQAGDPTASGSGGPGYSIPDEFPEAGFVYKRGVLAMANAGPGSSGSQFFMMLDDAGLPPAYSVFGQVTDGFDALDKMATVKLGQQDHGSEKSKPMETVYIHSVDIAIS